MEYEWDRSKRLANLSQHGLDFTDADLVLESPYVLIVDSPRKGEARKLAFAYVFEVLAVLSVAFVPGKNRCRIVSFRPANRKEREIYHAWLEKDGLGKQ
ncbi:BrnT family toxin [Fontimonas sp. SYSU GA230001]|uniref:BrnT family toxin n=1 Tax=Fontimonas sp. SYSU GA230001 TaxID=3142450 RepID=UPI0032B4A3DB